MSETLVIRFQDPADDAVHWYFLDSQGQRLGGPGQGRLADCKAKAEKRRVVALMPGERVSLMDAHIPTRKKQRILQAVPWVLEERLAQDVESLHFALGPRQADDSIRVAVVSRDDMSALCRQCEANGIIPDAIMPDYLALPRNDREWTAMVEGDRVIVRTGDHDGFTTDRELVLDMLEFSLPDITEKADSSTENLCLMRPETDSAFMEGLQQRFGDRLALDDRPYREDADQVFVPVVDLRRGIDLAEGEFRLREEDDAWWRPWRPVVALTSAWLLVLAVSEAVHLYQLSADNQALDAEIEQVFREALPDAQRMVDPRLRMEQRLNALRGTGSQGQFLPTLAAMGEGMAVLSNGSIRGLSYRPGVLDIHIRVDEGHALDSFKDAVEAQQGYEAVIQSANTGDDYVDGRLQIRGPGGR